jgi:hypothetical protein
VTGYLNNKHDDNVLIVSYEQLHEVSINSTLYFTVNVLYKIKCDQVSAILYCLFQQPEACIEQIARFLGVHVDSRQVSTIANYCKFDKMSVNPTVNYSWWDTLGIRRREESKFMRKGCHQFSLILIIAEVMCCV